MAEQRSTRRGRIAAAVVGLGILAALLQVGSPAQASFPGTDGNIAYINAGNIFLINPDAAPIPQQITTGGGFTRVNYNATANRLVAKNASGIVFLDPTPGSTITQLTGGNAADNNPAAV